MSGAEAIAVLGVISSIIGIVDGIKKVYDASTDQQGLPAAFRDSAGRLPIVRSTLKLAEQRIKDGENNGAEAKQFVEACELKAKNLERLFQKTIPRDGASPKERYWKAVKALGKGNKVEDLMKGILEDVKLLSCEHGMRFATPSQKTQISQAIAAVSALPASVSDDIFQDSGFAANNYGPGRQANAPGGKIVMDDAKQYDSGGGTMNIGNTYSHTTVQTGSSSPASAQTDIQACMSAIWLADPKDDREALKHIKGSRVDGTCTWIEDHEVYKSWLSSDAQLLWLSGSPGKGKTMISIYIAEELELGAKYSQNTVLLQYFCDNGDEKRNTATTILRGLVFQLLHARPHLFAHILPSYRIQKERLFLASSFQSLWRIFEAMLRDPVLGKVYCVLDGLDECEKGSLSMILEKFRELFGNNAQNPRAIRLNLIIASRDDPMAIPRLLSGFPRIRLDPDADTEVNQDIDLFIEAKVTELSEVRRYSPQLSEYITKIFRERAQGTFLWVGIVADQLRNCLKHEVKNYLDGFPSGLDKVYARILLGIEIARREIIAKMLRWTIMAVRPLTLAELGVAIDVPVDPIIPFPPAEIAKDYISCCGNFLTITGDEVHLIHQSAKDYLLCIDIGSNPELEVFVVKEEIASLEIVSRCFNYLQEGALADGPVDLEKDKAHLTKFPLLSYAVVYWPLHAKSFASPEEIISLLDPFGPESRVRVFHFWLKSYPESRELSLKPQPPHTFLHTAPCLGLRQLVENVLSRESRRGKKRLFGLEENADREIALELAVDSWHDNKTELEFSVETWHEEEVRLLIDKGADLESKCDCENGNGRTALYIAAKLGHDSVARLLLHAGADTETKSGGETALFGATTSGDNIMVQLLLENGADIETKGHKNMTPLHIAVQWKDDVVVQLLLENGADTQSKDIDNLTALHYAAKEIEEKDQFMVQRLLDREEVIEAKDCDDTTTSHLATPMQRISKRDSNIVRLLLENGADIDAKDCHNMTALHYAATAAGILNRDPGVVRLLLENKADIEAKDCNNMTALHHAVAVAGLSERDSGIVRLLLENGADIEAKDPENGTVLHYAAVAAGRDLSIVRLLLENGADIEAKNCKNMTVLHCAASGYFDGNSDLVRLLLDCGADLEAKDFDNKTALHRAAGGRWERNRDIVRLLLDKGANASATDWSGKTPRDIANGELLEEVVMGHLYEVTDEHREIRQAIIRLLSPDG